MVTRHDPRVLRFLARCLLWAGASGFAAAVAWALCAPTVRPVEMPMSFERPGSYTATFRTWHRGNYWVMVELSGPVDCREKCRMFGARPDCRPDEPVPPERALVEATVVGPPGTRTYPVMWIKRHYGGWCAAGFRTQIGGRYRVRLAVRHAEPRLAALQAKLVVQRAYPELWEQPLRQFLLGAASVGLGLLGLVFAGINAWCNGRATRGTMFVRW